MGLPAAVRAGGRRLRVLPPRLLLGRAAQRAAGPHPALYRRLRTQEPAVGATAGRRHPADGGDPRRSGGGSRSAGVPPPGRQPGPGGAPRRDDPGPAHPAGRPDRAPGVPLGPAQGPLGRPGGVRPPPPRAAGGPPGPGRSGGRVGERRPRGRAGPPAGAPGRGGASAAGSRPAAPGLPADGRPGGERGHGERPAAAGRRDRPEEPGRGVRPDRGGGDVEAPPGGGEQGWRHPGPDHPRQQRAAAGRPGRPGLLRQHGRDPAGGSRRGRTAGRGGPPPRAPGLPRAPPADPGAGPDRTAGGLTASSGRGWRMGTGQVAVRRNVWSLDPTEAFASQVTLNYARAVRVMQQRDSADPTSWTWQANVHGTYDQVPPGAAWNQCQHGTWFFLPWHRMYLYCFEQVVREAIAEAGADPTGWALPYWNYSDGPQPPVNTLPLAFRVPELPDGTANPLSLPYPLRNDGTDPRVPLAAGVNDGGQLPAFYLDYRQGVPVPEFAYPPAPDPGFGGPQTGVSHRGATHGALEQQPHDLLHVLVGGVPAGQCRSGWMSDPDCAARDPIFWLHHANIDRLWKRWLDVAGHADPVQARWLDPPFRFYDPARQEIRAMTSREVLDTVEQLGYGYDDDPPAAVRPVRRAAAPEPVAAHLNLNLEGVERDPGSALLFEVYLNLPAEAPPDPGSPYYVGHFAF